MDLLVDLVAPEQVAEGEAFELDDEHFGQPPQRHLFGGLAVLLAPASQQTNKRNRRRSGPSVAHQS